MTARIFAYRLTVEPRQMVTVPAGSTFLTVASDEAREVPILYYQVPVTSSPSAAFEHKIIRVVTTGDTYNAAGMTFLGLATIKEWFRAFIFEEAERPDPVDQRSAADFAEILASTGIPQEHALKAVGG